MGPRVWNKVEVYEKYLDVIKRLRDVVEKGYGGQAMGIDICRLEWTGKRWKVWGLLRRSEKTTEN